jgi:nucleoside-diphosphate-sugar epimerase
LSGGVLVTGGTGFIGTPLVRKLLDERQHVVVVIPPGQAATAPRSSMEADLLDLRSLESLAEARPSIAILGAWCAQPPAYLTSPENVSWVSSTITLARALLEKGCKRIVGLGTCFEYDTSLGYLSERSDVRPHTLYAAGKVAAFSVLRQLCADFGATFVWPRIFYQYGPGEHPQRIVAATIRSVLRGERAPLTSGQQVRDFLHVDDVAKALSAVTLSSVEGPVNIGSGRPVTVREVAEAIGAACGRSDLLGFGDLPARPGDPAFVCADVAKLRALGFEPRFGLRDGLEDAVSWWRSRMDARA